MTGQAIFIIAVLGYALWAATNAILARLPKPTGHTDFKYLTPTEGVRFRIDSLTEDEFKVGWVSGWELGRSFTIGGESFAYANEEATKGGLKFTGRQSVRIHPTDEWFKDSRIGAATPNKRGASMHVFLPWQLSRQILEDLRHNLDQVCDISIAQTPDWKEGNKKVRWGIYHFELAPAENYPFGGFDDIDSLDNLDE